MTKSPFSALQLKYYQGVGSHLFQLEMTKKPNY